MATFSDATATLGIEKTELAVSSMPMLRYQTKNALFTEDLLSSIQL